MLNAPNVSAAPPLTAFGRIRRATRRPSARGRGSSRKRSSRRGHHSRGHPGRDCARALLAWWIRGSARACRRGRVAAAGSSRERSSRRGHHSRGRHARDDPMSAVAAHAVVAAGPLTNGQVPLGEAVAFWILGPISLAGGIGMVRAPQRDPLGAVAGRHDDEPRRVLRHRAGPVPRPGADHRLHRRDHDPVPVRADAGRARLVRLARRDAARAALGGGAVRHRLRAARRAVGRPRVQGHQAGEPRRARTPAAQRQLDRRAAVHEVPVRVRAHLRAADRRGRRRDGARAHRARRAQADAEGARPRADPLRPAAAAARPGRALHRQLDRHARRCCPTARSRTSR